MIQKHLYYSFFISSIIAKIKLIKKTKTNANVIKTKNIASWSLLDKAIPMQSKEIPNNEDDIKELINTIFFILPPIHI